MDSLLPATVDDCDLYIFTSYQVLKEWLSVADALDRHGFYRKAVLVWEKSGPGQGELEYWGMGMEFILYLKKGKRPRSGPRRNAVLHFPQLRPEELIHPHEKPTSLIAELIRFSSNRGDFIVDPFAGSGAVIRAAKEEGRNAIGIELDKLNFDRAYRKLHTESDALL
jgi:site-specific DNA-methyltransferase (adenine-specific)